MGGRVFENLLHRNNMKKIEYVGVGFCSNDDISLLPEIPLDSKVRILEHTIQGGGPAATSTVAASRLGLKSAFISAIGDDDAGRRIISDFNSEKVDTSAIVMRKGKTSPIAYCWVDKATGKRSVAWTRGDTQELETDEVKLDILEGAKILHLDGHNPKAALAAVKRAKELGVIVNFDAGTVRDGVAELMPYADILICSEAFARAWTKNDNLKKALIKLSEYGAKVTGCTMGEFGSMVYANGKYIECPAFKIKPVDTTGAGDVFHASFAVRYLETQDIFECLRFASAVSAIKCGKIGGRAGIPNRAKVDEFLKNNK